MTHKNYWLLVLIAAAILMITMGARQSQGLFVQPLMQATGLGIASVSFAMAVGQLVWGAVQPAFGAVADRWGPGRVLAFGAVLLAIGSALTTQVSDEWSLLVVLGIVSAAGAGAGSFSVLAGATARHVPEQQRSLANGVISAGSSMGQFVFVPLYQAVISAYSWLHAMWLTAALALSTGPLSWWLRGRPEPQAANAAASGVPAEISMREQLKIALCDRSYWCLLAGFFTCGFHVAFLVTHLPNEVGLCGLHASVASVSLGIIGLANIFGSLAAGALGSRVRMKLILFWMYASRAIVIVIYLAAPKTPWTFYLFAASLGSTWLATVPPTAGLIGKLFGIRYLSTLFGITLFSHQLGGFFGAWLGGIAIANSGSYVWMWWADAALALLAALVNLPIREGKVVRLYNAERMAAN